ncbi:DUF6301 family protein [Nocardia tengchongensis]|uniref:DUF6301 family protein n=1 Tax=Nocardia tengchongensis TaxID=2055889 RepID=UPI0036A2170C
MRADYDGADRIASAAAEFDWTWTAGDIQRFCDVLGWRIAETDSSAVTLATNISVGHPESFAYFDSDHRTELGDSDQAITWIWIAIMDDGEIGDPGLISSLDTVFREFGERMTVILGEPTSRRGWDSEVGWPNIVWETSGVVIQLTEDVEKVSVSLRDPVWFRASEECRATAIEGEVEVHSGFEPAQLEAHVRPGDWDNFEKTLAALLFRLSPGNIVMFVTPGRRHIQFNMERFGLRCAVASDTPGSETEFLCSVSMGAPFAEYAAVAEQASIAMQAELGVGRSVALVPRPSELKVLAWSYIHDRHIPYLGDLCIV